MLLGLPHLMSGWWVFIAFPLNYSHWTERCCFYRRAHRIIRCPPDMHCSWSGALATSADRWIRPLADFLVHIGQSYATARGCQVVGPSAQTAWCPTGQSGAHQTGYCSLSGAPPERWLTAHFIDFFAVSFGLLSSWVLDFYTSFMSLFEVLHPQCLSPIMFASCEL
jgi:hypothetical protein